MSEVVSVMPDLTLSACYAWAPPTSIGGSLHRGLVLPKSLIWTNLGPIGSVI